MGRAARAPSSTSACPCFFNGLGRGTLPADHELAFLRTRGLLKQRADLVVVLGTPLDFRLGFGRFGDAQVAHVVDARVAGRARTSTCATVGGRPRADVCARWPIARRAARPRTRLDRRAAAPRSRAGAADGRRCSTPTTRRSSPSRIYGELGRRLARDAVVICDGGDFASYAGKFVEVFEPGCWLDTGPYGCLGNGPGYAIAAARRATPSQIVLLLGDGAAGFSLMDVDSMVRHGLPVVMVVGNNGIWGLEKHPMQVVYGWDVACDLQPGMPLRRGRAGPRRRRRAGHRSRARSARRSTAPSPSGVPYLVNVLTEPTDVYPRTSNLG